MQFFLHYTADDRTGFCTAGMTPLMNLLFKSAMCAWPVCVAIRTTCMGIPRACRPTAVTHYSEM